MYFGIPRSFSKFKSVPRFFFVFFFFSAGWLMFDVIVSTSKGLTHPHTLFPRIVPYFCGREFDNFEEACFGLDGSTLSTQCFAEMLGRGLALRKLDKYKRTRIFARFRTNDPDYGCVVTFGLGSLSCVCVYKTCVSQNG